MIQEHLPLYIIYGTVMLIVIVAILIPMAPYKKIGVPKMDNPPRPPHKAHNPPSFCNRCGKWVKIPQKSYIREKCKCKKPLII